MTSAGSAPRYHSGRPPDVHRPSIGHRYRHYIQELAATIEDVSRDLNVDEGSSLLDYGCAEIPYRYLFPDETDYVAADIAGNAKADLDIRDDGTLPVEDGSFDAAISTQVLEHVTDPRVYLSECARALRPGGRLMLSTHGIFVYHPDPDDYWRWTCAGMRAEIERSGLKVIRLEGVIGLLPMAMQLAQDAVYWKLPAPLRPLLAMVGQTLIRLVDRAYSPSSKRLNASVFVIVAEKPI